MFRYNPSANYQLSRYLQILSGKDLYNQTIAVRSDDTFHARFPNIFVDYALGSMRVGDTLWTNWKKVPFRLWQTRLNFAVFCASSACGVSSEHYAKHPMVRSLYRFDVYYCIRRILKRLLVPLPHQAGFKASDNSYTNEDFFKTCEDYEVPHNPMKYRNEKLHWTYQ